MAYNYMTDLYSTNAGWLYPSVMAHDAATLMNLVEGNHAPTVAEDAIHGTHAFNTYFRNYLSGRDGSQTGQTVPGLFQSYSRYVNFIGNVLGTSGYHTNYQSNAPTATSCDKSIYNLGWSSTVCRAGSNAFNGDPIPNDPLVASTMMRWGNYDVVGGAPKWNASEVPSGIASFANPVPASQTLPASFYLSAKPSWWGSVAWPAIGPEVSGGVAASGKAHYIPAKRCYDSTPKDANGILKFDADTCYASSAAVGPNPPTGLTAQSN
jgi:hypothetical protein